MIKVIVEHHHYVHQNGNEDSQVVKLIKQILNINQNIMGIVEDLNAKMDTLQTTIDETQSRALIKIVTLEATVQELRDTIANGGNEAALLAIAKKMDDATADLRSTFEPDETEEA